MTLSWKQTKRAENIRIFWTKIWLKERESLDTTCTQQHVTHWGRRLVPGEPLLLDNLHWKLYFDHLHMYVCEYIYCSANKDNREFFLETWTLKDVRHLWWLDVTLSWNGTTKSVWLRLASIEKRRCKWSYFGWSLFEQKFFCNLEAVEILKIYVLVGTRPNVH